MSNKFLNPLTNESFLTPVGNDQHSPNSNQSFLVDLADVHSMKQNLQELLVSFRAGKLKAFSDKNAIEQMENIRNMQVRKL